MCTECSGNPGLLISQCISSLDQLWARSFKSLHHEAESLNSFAIFPLHAYLYVMWMHARSVWGSLWECMIMQRPEFAVSATGSIAEYQPYGTDKCLKDYSLCEVTCWWHITSVLMKIRSVCIRKASDPECNSNLFIPFCLLYIVREKGT